MIDETSNSIIVQIQNIQFILSKYVDDAYNISNEISNMNDDLINYVKKFKIQNEFNYRVRDLVENVIVLTKISSMQINYIHETRFKYALRCSNRRIYDFLFEICFLEMMRSHYSFF